MPQGPAAKMLPKWLPGASPGASGALPALPREAEIDQLFGPSGHQEASNGFFRAQISKISSVRSLGPVGLVWSRRPGRPGGLRPIPAAPQGLVRGEPPGGLQRAILEPFWTNFGAMFGPKMEQIWEPFGTPPPLFFVAPVTC